MCFRSSAALGQHLSHKDCSWESEHRTVVEAGEADLEAVERGQTVLPLQACHVHIVLALHPYIAERLQPGWRQDLDVFSKLGDIAVFGAVRVAGDEVGYV
jgi:hypothetical protein